MFLKDEFAVNRLRALRLRCSLLIAVMTVAASLVTGLGFASAARAGEASSSSLSTIERSFPLSRSLQLPQIAASSTHRPASRHHADDEIMRGLTLILLAATGTSLLAVWRRRIRDRVLQGAARHAR